VTASTATSSSRACNGSRARSALRAVAPVVNTSSTRMSRVPGGRFLPIHVRRSRSRRPPARSLPARDIVTCCLTLRPVRRERTGHSRLAATPRAIHMEWSARRIHERKRGVGTGTTTSRPPSLFPRTRATCSPNRRPRRVSISSPAGVYLHPLIQRRRWPRYAPSRMTGAPRPEVCRQIRHPSSEAGSPALKVSPHRVHHDPVGSGENRAARSEAIGRASTPPIRSSPIRSNRRKSCQARRRSLGNERLRRARGEPVEWAIESGSDGIRGEHNFAWRRLIQK